MIKIGRILRGLHKYVSMVIAIIFSVVTIPLGYYADFTGRFHDFSIVLGYIPFYLGEWSRYFYYKALLVSVGKNTVFKFGSYCQYRNASIGENVLFGYHNTIGEVEVGNDVLIGNNVIFTSGLNQHSFDDPNKKIREHSGKRERIRIGSDIWIGNKSTICANIGNRSVIGVDTLVINDLPSRGVFVGSPARKVKDL